MRASDTTNADFEILIDAAVDIGSLLSRYINVHDGIFKTSFRHIIPIPWIFKDIDFQAHFESLGFIVEELRTILQRVEDSQLRENEFAVTLLMYGSALHDAIAGLREVCGNLFQMADRTIEYSKSHYNHDLEKYNKSVAQYQVLGSRVNAFFGR